jgi:hypothetical protein
MAGAVRLPADGTLIPTGAGDLVGLKRPASGPRISLTFALTIRSSLVSNMAWFTCRICLGMVIVACFPIAVNSLATQIVHRRQAMPHYFNKHQPICAKIRALSINPRRKIVIALWILLAVGFSFAVFKNFTAIDTHTIHETKVIEKEYMDTHNVENFVEKFAKVYYSWEQSSTSIDSRTKALKNYLTEELQALNNDTVRKDIPVSSSLQNFQIWSVKNTGNHTFDVTYSVEQLITEGESKKNVQSAYFVSVYVDSDENMVIIKNPTITSIPSKSSYQPKIIENDGTVDSVTANEINDFLTTFFKLYPTATQKELSYYVTDGILKPVGKEYVFQELVNSIYNRKENQVTAVLAVKYLDPQTKATQVSQFSLTLEKNDGNWKIVK